MSRQLLLQVFVGFYNVLLVLLIAPLAQGVARRVTARIQSRVGPPLLQPYYDLFKLLGKEDLASGVSPALQRFAAYLALTTVLVIACLAPMGMAIPLQGYADAVLLIYLLTLSGISLLLAGLAAGSSYSLLGISREMMTMLTLEPLFAITLVIAGLHGQSFDLATLFSGAIYQTGQMSGWPLSGYLMLGVMLLSFQAFVGRAPFDITEAETEIMEGPLIEYSGPKLALFKYAQMVKLVVFAALFIGLFAPWGSAWLFPFGLLFFWFKVALFIALVTLIAATHARIRMDQAIRYFGKLALVSCAALALAVVGM